MSRRRRWLLIAANVLIAVAVISSCRSQADEIDQDGKADPADAGPALAAVDGEPSQIEPTRSEMETGEEQTTPQPVESDPKELVICVGSEPNSLYPYSGQRLTPAAEHLIHGLYEPMFTTLSYDYQARGVEKLPNLADGDATIKRITVREGDRVFNNSGEVVILREGVKVKNMEGRVVEFDGSPITMPQMVTSFTLKPLVWSDGTPVTADDSVYSFELAADPQTPIPKQYVQRTADYRATGNLTLEWKGVPGYLVPDYFTYVWMPYPRHYWGQFTADELLVAEAATKQPLSHGPFVVEEWVEGDHITLVQNEHYYLADQGLPKLDVVRVQFVPSASQLLAQLLAGECDIGTHDGLSLAEAQPILEAEQDGLLEAHFQSGPVFEHIDFGINPIESYTSAHLDWFEDVRVRQAIIMCTDRQRMVDEILFGQGEVIHAYIPATHPLYPDDLAVWLYDLPEANALLDEVGFKDTDADGIREYRASGVPLSLTLLAPSGNEIGEQVATIFQENMADCGIQVTAEFIHPDQYYADGPSGPLFGRQFELAAFPWLISIEPNCALYLSSRIPAPDNSWNRNYNNDTGFSNEAFDAACQAALALLPGMDGYEENHQEALRIWSEQMPIIPLFMRLKVAATRPGVQNFIFDPTQNSELWNLFELDIEE